MSEAFILNSRYRLTVELGSGGMAVVYKAIDLELGRQVAVKLLREGYANDDAFLTRFQREARAAASLDHPNVVSIYDIGRDGKLYYIVMEHVEGRSLRSLLRAGAPLPVGQAMDLAIQICAGVGAAHRAGLIHCDLKPQNILVTSDGRAKVVDFGIARALEAKIADSEQTVWATPQYAAPEQTQGRPLRPSTDVYAIGIILYQMLAGQLPFQGRTVQELAVQHARNPPPPLTRWNPQVPPRLEQIVLKALAKEPSRRYPTATQLGQLLIEYRRVSEQATSAQPVVPLAIRAAVPSRAVETPAHGPVAPAGPDWLAWFLGALAVIMIAGLVPVWLLVSQRYTLARAPVVPTPFATLTVILPPETVGQRIAAPNVIGLEQEEARRFLEDSNLGFAVVGERHDIDIPPLHVVAQTIAPGQEVDRGSVVGVILSQGPRFVSVPDVVGLPASSVEPGLKEIGLIVGRKEAWSAEPKGIVIAQEPPANTLIAEGSTVTLTVSTGARLPFNASLGNEVMLVAAEMERIEVLPGDTLMLTLHWRALVQMSTPYTVFVHLTRADGGIVAQQDNEPRDGTYPTTMWQVDEQVRDSYAFLIPDDMLPGSYWIKVGMYTSDTSQRLPVVDPGTAQVENDSVVVREFRVINNQ
jgi:serine/threonine-protein kinase